MRSVDGSPERHSSPIIRESPGRSHRPPRVTRRTANARTAGRTATANRMGRRFVVERVYPPNPQARAPRVADSNPSPNASRRKNIESAAPKRQDNLEAKSPFKRQNEKESRQRMEDFVLRIGGERLARGEIGVPERQPGRALGKRNQKGLRGAIKGLKVPFEEGLSPEQGLRKQDDRAETHDQDKDPELPPPARIAHGRRV